MTPRSPDLPFRASRDLVAFARDGHEEAAETVRAEPFDAIEIAVGVLFGDEEDE